MIVNKPTNAFHVTSLNMKKTTTYDTGDPGFYLAEALVVGTTPFTWSIHAENETRYIQYFFCFNSAVPYT